MTKWLREPIRDARKALWEELDERILAGFGGVSEYGITVRWDKNFLKVIRIALERKNNIRVYGGVRFGGTLTIEDAFDTLGFDHIAIAAGAGTPTIVRMKNNLIRGIRKASDFLMALQLTGAFKKSADGQPAGAPAGGRHRRRTDRDRYGHRAVRVLPGAGREDPRPLRDALRRIRRGGRARRVRRRGAEILDEFLEHGRAVRAERERARPRRRASRTSSRSSARGAA